MLVKMIIRELENKHRLASDCIVAKMSDSYLMFSYTATQINVI